MTAGAVVWLTGLPSSGKSTLAAEVRRELERRGTPSCILDGDEIRGALVPPPGYDDESRTAFYSTLGNLAALLAAQGLVVLVPATANRRAYRERARTLSPRWVEVYVGTPHDECARRDTKHLYAGAVPHLPGAGADYEAPLAPDVFAPHGGGEAARAAVLRAIEQATGS